MASDSRKVEHLQGRVGSGDDAGGGGKLPEVDLPLETKLTPSQLQKFTVSLDWASSTFYQPLYQFKQITLMT